MMLRFMVPQEWPAPAEWAAEALRQISAGAPGNRRPILNAQLLVIRTGEAGSLPVS
jgi:hypothetical protein